MQPSDSSRENDATRTARWMQAMWMVAPLAIAAGMCDPYADPRAIPRATAAARRLFGSWKSAEQRREGGRDDAQ